MTPQKLYFPIWWYVVKLFSIDIFFMCVLHLRCLMLHKICLATCNYDLVTSVSVSFVDSVSLDEFAVFTTRRMFRMVWFSCRRLVCFIAMKSTMYSHCPLFT